MAPPEFNDISKAAKDLLNKDYNFGKTKLEAKTVTQNGVEFNSLLDRNDSDGTLSGELKAKFKHADSGLIFTETYDTNNKLNVKVEAPGLVDGLKLDVDGTFNPFSASKEAKLAFAYKTDSLTTTGSLNAFQKPTLKVDAVTKYEGLLVGGQASLNVEKSAINDYSVTVGYSDADYTASFQAVNKLEEAKDSGFSFNASYSHNVSSKVSVAGIATWRVPSQRALFEFGTQYKLEGDSAFKAKVDSDGKVGLGFSQRLRPDLKASFGLLINTRNLDQNAHKFGYSFVFEPK